MIGVREAVGRQDVGVTARDVCRRRPDSRRGIKRRLHDRIRTGMEQRQRSDQVAERKHRLKAAARLGRAQAQQGLNVAQTFA